MTNSRNYFISNVLGFLPRSAYLITLGQLVADGASYQASNRLNDIVSALRER